MAVLLCRWYAEYCLVVGKVILELSSFFIIQFLKMLITLLKLFDIVFNWKEEHLQSIYKLIKEVQNVCH